MNINGGKQGSNEAGALLLAIQTVSNNLKEMIGQIVETSNKLNDSSSYLSNALDKTSNGVKDQFSAITESITKLNDMNTQSASASEEQRVATEQVNESMKNGISQENHTILMEIVKYYEALVELSVVLNTTVKQSKM
ncbi:hypothetical protein [Aliivibrio finisterrensis]|uniref:hypothetical protein n=1 Tax=Aliivibrio finisterrensis TaxID=511998 RepID=UPI00124BD05B|nr:hypothetical protein [Aliivibrio finisterrensis]